MINKIINKKFAFFILGFAYILIMGSMQLTNATIETCGDCYDCQDKINYLSNGDTLNIINNLYEGTYGYCIYSNGNMFSNISIDCLGNLMGGDNLGGFIEISSFKENLSISNCIIFDYGNDMYANISVSISNIKNVILTNMTFTNLNGADTALLLKNGSQFHLYNVTVNDANSSIRLDSIANSTIEYTIANINITENNNNISIKNIPVHNLTSIFVNYTHITYNITNCTNITEIQLLPLITDMILQNQYDQCIDDNLYTFSNYVWSNENGSFTTIFNSSIPCSYGCSEAMCNPSPFWGNIIFFFILIFIVLVIIGVLKLKH